MQSSETFVKNDDAAVLPSIEPKPAPSNDAIAGLDEVRQRRIDLEAELADARLAEHEAELKAGVTSALPNANYRGLTSTQINQIGDPDARRVHLGALDFHNAHPDEAVVAQQKLGEMGRQVPLNQAVEILAQVEGR